MLVVEVWDANVGTLGIGGVGIGAGGIAIGGVSIGTGASVGPQIVGYFAARVVELREGVRPHSPHPHILTPGAFPWRGSRRVGRFERGLLVVRNGFSATVSLRLWGDKHSPGVPHMAPYFRSLLKVHH